MAFNLKWCLPLRQVLIGFIVLVTFTFFFLVLQKPSKGDGGDGTSPSMYCTMTCYQPPSFRVVRLNDEKPILSSRKSNFTYNYNAAWIPLFDDPDGYTEALIVRVQDPLTEQDPYKVAPSLLAISKSKDGFEFTDITYDDVILSPDSPDCSLGVEDPRVVVVDDKEYLMFYTAVMNGTTKTDLGQAQAVLALAAANLTTPTKWDTYGPLFDISIWSKSGALIMRDKPPHYLLWGDKDICIALSWDLRSFPMVPASCPIKRRPGMWDSVLVESGPPPLRLSDGNYLFLYNSAWEADLPSLRQNWHLEYNLGCVILDKDDPTKVLYRSEEPIFSPTLSWEKCAGNDPLGLMPYVVFIEGWKQMAPDHFRVYYQGCDSFLGVFDLVVSFD